MAFGMTRARVTTAPAAGEHGAKRRCWRERVVHALFRAQNFHVFIAIGDAAVIVVVLITAHR